MNKKLIIALIIIVIIIILILTNKEHFDDAYNNIIDMINDEKIKSKNIEISNKIITDKLNSNEISINEINIMNILYPINSIWLSLTKYDLTNEEELKNTPLYYGKWELLNTTDNNVLGLIKNGETSIIKGTNTLTSEQLPAHSHKGIIVKYSYEPTGGNSGRHMFPLNNDKITEHNYNNNVYLLNSIGEYKNNNYSDYSTSDKLIIPKGYYLYGYKKISL